MPFFSEIASNQYLSQAELEEEAREMILGEDSDPDPFEGSGSDWEQDNLQVESMENSDEFYLDKNCDNPIQQPHLEAYKKEIVFS